MRVRAIPVKKIRYLFEEPMQPAKDILISIIQDNPGITKTGLVRTIKAYYWRGYANAAYRNAVSTFTTTLAYLIKLGRIKYESRQPLEVVPIEDIPIKKAADAIKEAKVPIGRKDDTGKVQAATIRDFGPALLAVRNVNFYPNMTDPLKLQKQLRGELNEALLDPEFKYTDVAILSLTYLEVRLRLMQQVPLPDAFVSLQDFSLSLMEIAKLCTFANTTKYERSSWLYVPNGQIRYLDALYRHYLIESIEAIDPEHGLLHLVSIAWNALALLTLSIEKDNNG